MTVSRLKRALHLEQKEVYVDGGKTHCRDDRRLADQTDYRRTNYTHENGLMEKTYEEGKVAEAIREKRLAPFYEEKDGQVLMMNYLDISTTSVNAKKKKRNKKKVVERRMEGPLECPICFLSHPENINHLTCCRQPICTFCLLHLRIAPSSRDIACPFCKQTDLMISYKSPDAQAAKVTRLACLLKKHDLRHIRAASLRQAPLFYYDQDQYMMHRRHLRQYSMQNQSGNLFDPGFGWRMNPPSNLFF